MCGRHAGCPPGSPPAQPLQSPILPASCRGSARAVPDVRGGREKALGRAGVCPDRGSARPGLPDGCEWGVYRVASPALPAHPPRWPSGGDTSWERAGRKRRWD